MPEPRRNPFQIDLNDLAGEWQRQPGYSRDAGHREAEARHCYTLAKTELSVIDARLYLRIRNDPGEYDLREKPTKDEIEAAVSIHEDHIHAQTAVNQAQYEWDIAKADTVAFIDRRKALENEVQLIALNYWSEAEPQPLSDESESVLKARRRRSAFGSGIPDDE